VFLKDIKRTAIANHQLATGTGNYNRWSHLVPRERSGSVGKRRLSDKNDDYSAICSAPKAPRFDSSVVLGQLKEHEVVLEQVETALGKLNYESTLGQVLPQPVKDVIVGMGDALNLLLKSQKNLTSVLVDVVKVNEVATSAPQHKNSGEVKTKTKPPPPPPHTLTK
jgi:hypothetical protein